MASFSGPKLSNRIADDVPAIQEILGSLAKLTPDSGNTDYPNGTKRVAETTNGYEFQQWNGSSWVHLEKWNINAQKVDGYSASTGTTASTIPVRGTDGKIAGDITGNASTASSAAALSATNPIDKGGTGATTAAQARANLVVPPKSHASSSTEYGAGSSTQYGHLKSHDDPDSTLTAASGHAFSPAGAASLKDEIDGKLSTSGGAMTGSLTLSQFTFMPGVDTSYIFAQPDDVWANGARIQLNPGSLGGDLTLLAAKDGVGTGFYVKPGDGAYVDSKKVLTSAGGTMTGDGAIIFDKAGNITALAGKQDGTTRLTLSAGGANGGFINLIGQQYDSDLQGGVQVVGVRPDGTFQILDVSVLGVNVNGNPVLTSAGGTITGSLLVTNILSNANNGFGLYGGNTWRTGGYIELGGPNHTYPNYVQIKGGSGQLLKDIGKGWYIDGSFIVALMAMWRSGNDWYRKYSDGWIEQGGYVTKGSAPNATVTFHTPFIDTNYFFTSSATPGSADASGGDGHQNRKTTGCTILHTAFYHSGAGAYWYACGY